jgi:hypothetical protein
MEGYKAAPSSIRELVKFPSFIQDTIFEALPVSSSWSLWGVFGGLKYQY